MRPNRYRRSSKASPATVRASRRGPPGRGSPRYRSLPARDIENGGDSPISGQTVAEADRFESLTFAGLFRGEEMILPRGDTVIEPGDHIVVFVDAEVLEKVIEAI